jgi:hypothetical protein
MKYWIRLLRLTHQWRVALTADAAFTKVVCRQLVKTFGSR